MAPVVNHFFNTVICDVIKVSLLDKNRDQLMCVAVYLQIMKALAAL